MPNLEIRYSRRRVTAAFDQFEREFPHTVIIPVMRTWAPLVVARAKRTRAFRNRTGNLRRNMSATIQTRRALEIGFGSPGAPYGVQFLERGTRHIKARNFWRDSIRREQGRLPRMLRREIQQQARRTGLAR